MQRQPYVVAHRGASAHHAEHTLAAYELALEQGADGLECDIRVTRDGQLVCVHDRRVDRTSSGSGVVSELTLDRLSELDYGAWHDELPDSADELLARRTAVPAVEPRRRGVLTLEALLGMVTDAPGRPQLFVETKHPVRYAGLVEAKLVALLARHGLTEPKSKMDSQVVMMSFSAGAVRRFHQFAPKVPTVLLFGELPRARRDGSLPDWADCTGPGIRLLRNDPDYVARAAARGNPTYCWTVDADADVALCARTGVTYLATNAPARTRGLLDRHHAAD